MHTKVFIEIKMPKHGSGIKPLKVYVGLFSKKDVLFKCIFVVYDYSYFTMDFDLYLETEH